MSALPPVSAVVPHKPPMILIDELLEYVPLSSLSSLVRLTDRSQFVEAGRAPAVITLEYMAQTIAAYAGLTERAKGLPAQKGFIIACREMVLEVDDLAAGDELLVEIKEAWSHDALGHFDCKVSRAGEPISRASLSVYQGEIGQAGE